LPQPYQKALEYALKAKDVPAMTWAAHNLLARDWPLRSQEIHETASKAVRELAGVLAKDGRAAEADNLTQALTSTRRRDLVVRLLWQGDADLDLEIKEPVGTVCSYLHRQSPGGGTLMADLAAANRSETYLASEAFPGDYQVTVRRIWGRPVGGKAILEVIHHEGTPQRRVDRQTVELDRVQTLTVNLARGRRTAMNDVPPLEAIRQLDDRDTAETTSTALQQLQNLATPIVTDSETGLRARPGIRDQSRRSSASKLSMDASPKPDDEIAGQGGVGQFANTAIPTGLSFTTQAVTSADRRYVRLSLNPVFSQVTRVQTFPVVPLVIIPGIPVRGRLLP
jgi:hypothetical protein